MPFSLPNLPYPADALEPHIDKMTMEIHHGRHHKAYVDNANKDSPYMNRQVSILGIDVWEHAYYLKYQNKRPDYVDAWWNVVNWKAVGERYASAKAGKL